MLFEFVNFTENILWRYVYFLNCYIQINIWIDENRFYQILKLIVKARAQFSKLLARLI